MKKNAVSGPDCQLSVLQIVCICQQFINDSSGERQDIAGRANKRLLLSLNIAKRKNLTSVLSEDVFRLTLLGLMFWKNV